MRLIDGGSLPVKHGLQHEPGRLMLAIALQPGDDLVHVEDMMRDHMSDEGTENGGFHTGKIAQA